ncbi:MAG TPA: hypothetical protein VI299_08575, partial [Polyangiales bacterium]
AIAELDELAGRPEIRGAFERRIREYTDELERLASRLHRREHQIAFIGTIGIGKSTAICRATGLETPGADGRPRAVLETGAGGITLCEVHLQSGPGHGILIEPRSYDEIRANVVDWVDQLLRSAEPGTEGGDGSEESREAVPRELQRALRNMSGLRPQRTKGPDGKTVRSDPARDLTARLSSSRDLVVEILNRMSLERRDRRDLWYEPGSPQSPLEWLRDTFAAINNGRHPDFSLPARIELVVPDLMPLGDVSVRIVDTRGIDHPTARADLEIQLSDPHTVAILCSGFNDAPTQPIQQLLQRARQADNPQIATNSAMLVLARPDEAMAVKDEAGLPVEAAEDGYELKGEQVANALSPYRLERQPILFFNSFDDDPRALTEFLHDRVAATRDEFRRQLAEVTTNAARLLANAEQQQVQEEQQQAAKHVNSWIRQHLSPESAAEHVHDTLLAIVGSAHPGTVHAAVRRDGEWQSLSYSHQLGFGSRRLTVITFRDSVNGFRELCATLSESLPEAAELLAQASRLMSQAYEAMLSKMQLAGVALYSDVLNSATAMWQACESEWGGGAGYRQRVVAHNREWFSEPAVLSLEQDLRSSLAREWSSVMDRVGSIFESE